MYFLLCFSGIAKFELWSQVTDLLDRAPDFERLLYNPHGMRYLLVLPFFILSEWFSVSYNWLFSNFVPVLIVIITACVLSSVARIHCGLGKNDLLILTVVTYSIFIVVSVFMNDRILFAVTGSSIMLYTFLRWDGKGFWELCFQF